MREGVLHERGNLHADVLVHAEVDDVLDLVPREYRVNLRARRALGWPKISITRKQNWLSTQKY